LSVVNHPLESDVAAPDLPSPAGRDEPTGGGTRGTRHGKLFRIRGELDRRWRIGLGALGVAVVGIVWAIAATRVTQGGSILPTPSATWQALLDLRTNGVLTKDLWASTQRILIGYSISVLIGMVVGLAIGSYSSVESFFEPQIGFLRYIPASALTPLFLLWLGIGESPKISLIVVGTMFFNILMMADVARSVPRELLNAAYTLGAGRWTVMRRVIFRYSIPGIIDAARVNLAAAWLMLVVAELLAAQEGLAYQIIRAQRFRAVDTMFALLIVFGIIGLVSDLALRGLRNWSAPWARS
jgi:NitT/TauT family transport system permease protein